MKTPFLLLGCILAVSDLACLADVLYFNDFNTAVGPNLGIPRDALAIGGPSPGALRPADSARPSCSLLSEAVCGNSRVTV
ncbi:MAG: hypothetical protein ACP5U2_02170 [Bryobacteraceae bacterium]